MQLFKRNRDRTSEEIGAVVAKQASSAADAAGRFVGESVDQANRALAAATESGGEIAESANDALNELRASLETSVRAQPLTALALAALAGMALGALWRTGER